MSGYTPLFDSLTRGTLCGRWPDIGLWPIILSLADKGGEVDVTPLYIAGITGLPEQEVIECMDRFCQPDRYSRSQEEGGRRLVLLDDHRNWGWRIVNHGRYREKARLTSKNAREVQEGKNRARMSDRRRPPETADDHPSNANANLNANNKNTMGGQAPAPPDEFEEKFQQLRELYPKRSGDQRWQTAKKHIRARLKEGHTWDEIFDGVRRYATWVKHTGKERTETVKQAATFLGTDKPFLEEFCLPVPSQPTRKPSYAELLSAEMKAKGMM